MCKIHMALSAGVGGEQAGGGWLWGWRVRMSPRKGSGPSMLLVVEAGKWRRLHAKERMAAADMWAALHYTTLHYIPLHYTTLH